MPEDRQMNTTDELKKIKEKDVPWQDAQYKFDGQWLPDVDSSLIGPENYQTLQNLRYGDDTLESISGYSRVNGTPITTYVDIKTGYQLRSLKTQTSYILVQAASAGGQGLVLVNRTAPGSTGNFDTTSKFAINGNTYYTDSDTGLQGRFSDAPQVNIAYCNSAESMIFGGDEQRVAACFSIKESLGSELITDAHNQNFSDTNEWVNTDMAAFDAITDEHLTITSDAAGQYCGLPQANAPTTVGNKYRLFYDSTALNPYAMGLYTIGGVQFIGRFESAQTQASIDFLAETTGGFTILSFTSAGPYSFDNFSLKQITEGSREDVTDLVTNNVTSDNFTFDAAGNNLIYIFTTRPIQSYKIYVDSANVSSSNDLITRTWTANGWTADITDTDGTVTGGVPLAKTGVVTLTSHTKNISKPMHFEELYLYVYSVELPTGSADIYQITVDPAMQTITDVWDGVYRQPIQFQVYSVDNYFDYTLQVQESSDLNVPIGAMLDGLLTTDKIYVMFEEQMSGIKMTMLGDLVNTDASLMNVGYWDGETFIDLVTTDGTLDANGDTCFAKTGLISWTPPSDEEPTTLFGSYGYVYVFTVTAALSSTTKGTPVEVLVDICTGIPAQLTVPPFDWSTLFGNRLMLGSYSAGNEGNRMDYSVSNAPDVWNGFDSSNDGKQSLYFGDDEKIVGATQIYNRFGANIYSMLLVLKHNAVYLLLGDTPEEFTIYPVTRTIGCISPLSIATTEIGMETGEGFFRNIAIWISHSGPVMFDGAVLVPISGINSYFDPTDSKYIKFSLMDKAVGWIDPNYKEYNIVIPSGTSATENNAWLVYDLAKHKWYEKVPASGHYPQCGFDVMSPTTGERYIYAGKDDGYMVQLENGNTWEDGSATGIAQSVTTGDFSPSDNIWDKTTLRKHKLITKYLAEVASTANTATIKYYKDTDTDSYTIGIVDLADRRKNQKLVQSIRNMNKTGVHHAFNYSATTTNVDKGFQPVSWGIQYRQERKENTAT